MIFAATGNKSVSIFSLSYIEFTIFPQIISICQVIMEAGLFQANSVDISRNYKIRVRAT